jgi:hypothetical protein
VQPCLQRFRSPRMEQEAFSHLNVATSDRSTGCMLEQHAPQRQARLGPSHRHAEASRSLMTRTTRARTTGRNARFRLGRPRLEQHGRERPAGRRRRERGGLEHGRAQAADGRHAAGRHLGKRLQAAAHHHVQAAHLHTQRCIQNIDTYFEYSQKHTLPQCSMWRQFLASVNAHCPGHRFDQEDC